MVFHLPDMGQLCFQIVFLGWYKLENNSKILKQGICFVIFLTPYVLST